MLLGFSSGIPFLLTLSTLSVWLKESGTSNTILGFFSLVTLPYTFKFLFAPWVDRLEIPYLGKVLGQRRSWALVSQASLAASLICLGTTHPERNLFGTAVMAVLVSCCAATQDLVLESYRIEITPPNRAGLSASSSYFGFRLGMMVSGAGALSIVAWTDSWFLTYCLMASLLVLGIGTIFLSPEPYTPTPIKQAYTSCPWHQILKTSWNALKAYKGWRVTVAFIISYKIGDTVLNVMNTPFFLELGLSKGELAWSKFLGMLAMLAGGAFGSLVIDRFRIETALLLCSILQIVSCWMLCVQAVLGHNLPALIVTISTEHFTCGLGASALMTYLASLTTQPYTATHYGILTSLGSCARIFFYLLAGWAADHVPWTLFFLGSGLLCCPGLVLLLKAPHHFRHSIDR